MTIYFQHVGESGAKRDFPKTIGTSEDGLRRFRIEDVARHLDGPDGIDADSLNLALNGMAPTGFQIWGLPSGAKSVLRDISEGDHLLLLEGAKKGGVFGYGGRVLYKTKSEQFRLSEALWGEAKFPITVFLDGALTSYPWERFVDEFGYAPHWNPAGQTYRLKPEKIAVSSFGGEAAAVNSIVYGTTTSGPSLDLEKDRFSDVAELDFIAAEGRQVLVQHLKRERSAQLVKTFKNALTDFKCSACGFDFELTYGKIGKAFIEVHHCKPVASMSDGEKTSLSDLIGVCSNCHRMLHRTYPALTVADLKGRFRVGH